MRLRLVLGCLPALVLVVGRDALPDGVGGEARGLIVRIRADLAARGDIGIVEHELEHVRQFYRLWLLGAIVNAPLAAWLAIHAGSPLTPLQAALAVALACMALHAGLYKFSRAYRELAEADAYRAQMRHPDGQGGRLTLELAAVRLAAPRYKLGLDVEGARVVLRTGGGNG